MKWLINLIVASILGSFLMLLLIPIGVLVTLCDLSKLGRIQIEERR